MTRVESSQVQRTTHFDKVCRDLVDLINYKIKVKEPLTLILSLECASRKRPFKRGFRSISRLTLCGLVVS